MFKLTVLLIAITLLVQFTLADDSCVKAGEPCTEGPPSNCCLNHKCSQRYNTCYKVFVLPKGYH
nr:venom peptide [Acharia stimulea]